MEWNAVILFLFDRNFVIIMKVLGFYVNFQVKISKYSAFCGDENGKKANVAAFCEK